MSSIVCKSSKAFTPGQTLLFTLPPQSGSPDTESHRSTPSGSSIGSFCGYPPVPLPLLDPRYRAFSRPCQNNWHLPPAGFPALLRTRIPSGRNWGWHAFCCLCARYAMPAFRYSFPADKSRPDHQQRADPRREKIHHIIQLRRGSAEVKILLILISYHRIHGIDCLI